MLILVFKISYAGNEVGNGGDVIVCKGESGKIERIELLDFYEARVQEKQELKDIEDSVPPLAQINIILDKVSKHNPKLAIQYKKRSNSFFKEVTFLEKAKLNDIDDSAHLILPRKKNCSIEQIAVFKKQKSKKNFLIDKKLWDKMNNTNKAGLILHEIIYEHLSYLGEKNSVKVRQINSLFFSKNMNNMDTKSYWKKLQDLKVPIYREIM